MRRSGCPCVEWCAGSGGFGGERRKKQEQRPKPRRAGPVALALLVLNPDVCGRLREGFDASARRYRGAYSRSLVRGSVRECRWQGGREERGRQAVVGARRGIVRELESSRNAGNRHGRGARLRGTSSRGLGEVGGCLL